VRFRTVLIVGVVGWGGIKLLQTPGLRPKWVDDLLLRAYAGDYVAMQHDIDQLGGQEAFGAVAKVAGVAGLPVLWVIALQDRGVPMAQLPAAAADTFSVVKDFGAPSTSSAEELLDYKTAVLAEVAKRHGGHALAVVTTDAAPAARGTALAGLRGGCGCDAGAVARPVRGLAGDGTTVAQAFMGQNEASTIVGEGLDAALQFFGDSVKSIPVVGPALKNIGSAALQPVKHAEAVLTDTLHWCAAFLPTQPAKSTIAALKSQSFGDHAFGDLIFDVLNMAGNDSESLRLALKVAGVYNGVTSRFVKDVYDLAQKAGAPQWCAAAVAANVAFALHAWDYAHALVDVVSGKPQTDMTGKTVRDIWLERAQAVYGKSASAQANTDAGAGGAGWLLAAAAAAAAALRFT
jgi:hypothetical protein